MNVHFLAFVVGLITLTHADVSHLKHASFASNTLSNDDHNQVAIKFNNAGNTQNPNYRYWWMNTDSSPFTKTHNRNSFQADVAASDEHQTQHITHDTHQQKYIQNPFLNAKTQQPRHYNNIYAHMATLSGSPSEVNSLMQDTTQTNYIADRYRPVPKTPCYGASQVCAPKDACQSGFISESNLGLVLSQSNNCDSKLETCCNIQPDAQQVPKTESCSDANSACVSSKFCFNGFIDQSVEHKAVRSADGHCYSPEVCCRFSDRRRSAPLFQDNDFAAASTSEVLTKEGYVVNVPSNQYLPSFPEPEFNPDASNDDVNRIRPDLPATTPRPTQPQPRPTQPQPRPNQPKCSNGAPDVAYPDCCTNGGSGPDCCTNRGYGPFCCTNGANNKDCSIETQPQPTYRPTQPQPRPTQPQPRPTQPQPRPTQPPYQPVPTTQRPTTQQPPRIVPTTTRQPYQQQPSQQNPSVVYQDQSAPIVPSACAAAMVCTPIEYCSATAVISKTPVVLSEFQKVYRVPMTDCMILPSKELGKCCRDPDYTDPWPVGRFGQYNADELNAVFDSGAYKPDRQNAASEIVSVRVAPDARNTAAAPSNQVVNRVAAPQARPYREISAKQPSNVVAQSQSCGVRNYNTQPRGKAPLGTGFGEFTWVTMIILESRKALLCGGTILDKNTVVTSANCVHGHRHNDVLIKSGEWRLGSDEEPKPFQIVRVQRIVFHPQFQPKSLEHDIAILQLENDIKYDTHVGPICLDETDATPSPSDSCVTTGWGKEVLKVHLGNALMQHTPVSALPDSECQARLQSTHLGYTNSLICGITQQDACEVDSGSALACADRSGRYTLKGVYSAETGCNESNQVVAYTRTDLQWIRSFLQRPATNY